MSKLEADFKAVLWEIQSKRGVRASVNFKVDKPHCDRCTNPNKRVVVAFEKPATYSTTEKSLKLCLDCMTDLIQEINKALDEFKLVRLVLTGQPASEALSQITESKTEQSDLQLVLNKLIDKMYSATGEYDKRREQKGQAITQALEEIENAWEEDQEEEDPEKEGEF